MLKKLTLTLFFLLLSALSFPVNAGPGTGTGIGTPTTAVLIDNISVAPCTSSSCQSTTTVIISGQNFTEDLNVVAIGQEDDQSHSGNVVGRTGSTEIIADFHNLPCYQHYGINLFSVNTSYMKDTYFEPTGSCIVRNPISWNTRQVSLVADDFYILTNGKKYVGADANISVHSDPGNKTYTTLEATWNEQGAEMRFYMYFNVVNNKWHAYETRTYDGNIPGNWIYYGELSDKSDCGGTLCGKQVGSELALSFMTMGEDPNNTQNHTDGTIYFENLHLKPFLNYKSIPSISRYTPWARANQGERITLIGKNFSPNTTVYIGGVPMYKPFYTISLDGKEFSFILDTEYTFTIGKKYDMYVQNENGASNKLPLTITSPLKLRSVSPTSANINQKVKLTGSGFGNVPGNVFILTEDDRFLTGTAISTWSDKQIVFTIPIVGGNKTYHIQVASNMVSNTLPLYIRAGRAIVSMITPKYAKPGEIITIDGTEFGTSPGTVKFITSTQKEVVASIVSWSDTEVKVTIPKVTSKLLYDIQLTASDGRLSDIITYSVGNTGK